MLLAGCYLPNCKVVGTWHSVHAVVAVDATPTPDMAAGADDAAVLGAETELQGADAQGGGQAGLALAVRAPAHDVAGVVAAGGRVRPELRAVVRAARGDQGEVQGGVEGGGVQLRGGVAAPTGSAEEGLRGRVVREAFLVQGQCGGWQAGVRRDVVAGVCIGVIVAILAACRVCSVLRWMRVPKHAGVLVAHRHLRHVGAESFDSL